MSYKITEVDYGSSRYNELLKLRYRVLKEALGLDFLDSFADKEHNYLHIAAIDEDEDMVIGGLVLAPLNNDRVRLMQVAVDHFYRRQGVGRDLVKAAEERAKEVGFKEIVFFAMISVVDFYKNMGYKIEGNAFEEKGASLIKMVKKLK